MKRFSDSGSSGHDDPSGERLGAGRSRGGQGLPEKDLTLADYQSHRSVRAGGGQPAAELRGKLDDGGIPALCRRGKETTIGRVEGYLQELQ